MCVCVGGSRGVGGGGMGWRGVGDREREEDMVLDIILDEKHLP